MKKGWIKLYRQFLEWEWYSDNNCTRVFLHCLLKANHQDKNYKGVLITRGSFVTSYEIMCKEIGLTLQQLRTAMKKLEMTGEITRKSTSKGTVITICNYSTYQYEDPESNEWDNNEVTNKQQTNNKRITTTKNEKNEKNANNEKKYIIPTLIEIEEYFIASGKIRSLDTKIEAENFRNYYEDLGWRNTKGKRIQNWKLQANTWSNNYLKYNKTNEHKYVDPF